MIVLLERGLALAGHRIILPEAEQHHLRVRRAREGDRVGVRDGYGLVAHGRLVGSDDGWAVELDAATQATRSAELVLAVGAGDRERFGWVVEKAVELGATSVIPLETERTGSVAGRVRPSHVDRLRRQAVEAVKQCGNPWAPAVEEPVALTAFLRRNPSGERWLGDVEGVPPPASGRADCTIIIGPEGGLTPGERQAALDAGYRPTSFGPHTLRLETAALAAAAAVQAARLRAHHG